MIWEFSKTQIDTYLPNPYPHLKSKAYTNPNPLNVNLWPFTTLIVLVKKFDRYKEF